jgi:sugar/nucleoside kinase (ribokinase family)
MQRLDQARAFEIGIGGSELNVACLLARLGRRAAWVSRLPEGPLGRIVDGEARRHGVDTRYVRWIEDARLGLMFFEPGPAPRNARVIYDRKHSVRTRLRGCAVGGADRGQRTGSSVGHHPGAGAELPGAGRARRPARRGRRQGAVVRSELPCDIAEPR